MPVVVAHKAAAASSNCPSFEANSESPQGQVITGGGGEASPRSEHSECAGCGSVILDRYYLLAVDRRWHSQCLKCSQCMTSLDAERSCFSRDGHIFCKEDYYKMFAVKRCTRCGQGIYANDLVMRARDNIYHINCFTCAWCNATLTQGDYFGISNNLVYCRTHFEMRTSNGGGGGGGTGGTGGGHQSQDLKPYGVEYFTPSEQAVHPIPLLPGCGLHHPGDFSSGGLPPSVYGALYGGSPSGQIGGLLASGGTGLITQPGPARKGRPRKRKSPVTADGLVGVPGGGGGGGGGGPCSLLDGNGGLATAQNSGLNGQNISGCSVDGLASGGSLHEASTPNGQQSACHGGSGRTKRMRTSFKHHQLRTMKQYFALNQNPDAKDLKQLAQKTGLSKRVLQVWFQNARAKWRRNNLKLQEQGCVSSGQLSGDGSVTSQGMGGPHSLINPGTPSTGIGSPGGSSTRQFSSPSPSLTGLHVSQDSGGGLPSTNNAPGSDGSSIDQSRNFEVLSHWTELNAAAHRDVPVQLNFPPI